MSDLIVTNTKKIKIQNEVRKFIIENFLFGQDDITIHEDDSFLQSGIVDSTGILELIGFIEEAYSIYVEDDEMLPENLDSLKNVSEFVIRKKQS